MGEGFDVEAPETNLVLVDVPDAARFVERLAEHGVHCFAVSATRLRLVFHLDVGAADVDPVIAAFRAARS
jgi:threonine aldolase